MNVVFINSTGETFTPTKSGAICTWIWEVCRAAEKTGVQPWVISRTSDVAAYSWPHSIFLDYPSFPKSWVGFKSIILQKRLTGWGHLRQHAYAARVADAIANAGLEKLPLFLQNDIELAVYLRKRFPKAFIVHHAQNNNPCSWRFRRQFAKAVNLATAVTSFCARWNSEYYGVEVKPLLSGVDHERFTPAVEPVPGPTVINFVGRTDPPKAPDLLLRAAKRLAARTKDFQIQLLGTNFYGFHQPDSFQHLLATLSDDLERDGIHVRRAGWVNRDSLPTELRKAHIHVVPARWDEPFGLTTLEGMACGLATVASATGGTPEVVQDSGFLFERGSEEALTDKLSHLVLNERLRTEYARKARERAEELTWDRTWSSLSELLTTRSNSPAPSLAHIRS